MDDEFINLNKIEPLWGPNVYQSWNFWTLRGTKSLSIYKHLGLETKSLSIYWLLDTLVDQKFLNLQNFGPFKCPNMYQSINFCDPLVDQKFLNLQTFGPFKWPKMSQLAHFWALWGTNNLSIYELCFLVVVFSLTFYSWKQFGGPISSNLRTIWTCLMTCNQMYLAYCMPSKTVNALTKYNIHTYVSEHLYLRVFRPLETSFDRQKQMTPRWPQPTVMEIPYNNHPKAHTGGLLLCAPIVPEFSWTFSHAVLAPSF